MVITHGLLARVADASYGSTKQIRNLGFDSVTLIECKLTGTKCYVAKATKTRDIVVTFRGSDNIVDWRTNFNVVKVHGSRMHKGFLEAYNSVEHRLLTELRECIGWNIYGAAHSLGGALINISATSGRIAYKEVVTFGQPRVYGIRSPATLAATRVTRYVNVSDLVCLVPFYEYKHLGNAVYIYNDEVISRVGKIRRWLEPFKIWKWYKAHSMSNYVKALN